MSWRGFFGFFNIPNGGFVYGMVVDGLGWRTSPTAFTEIQLKTPSMDNIITIPTTLRISYECCPVDIERGYNAYLGIDLALLGVVKRTIDSSPEPMTSPYGMNPRSSVTPDPHSGDKRCIRPDDMRLFGLCPGFGEYRHDVCRISKWMD